MSKLTVNEPERIKTDPARIDKKNCIQCLTCYNKCRFDAID
jgi:MinD superfamily P-loop ATPase